MTPPGRRRLRCFLFFLFFLPLLPDGSVLRVFLVKVPLFFVLSFSACGRGLLQKRLLLFGGDLVAVWSADRRVLPEFSFPFDRFLPLFFCRLSSSPEFCDDRGADALKSQQHSALWFFLSGFRFQGDLCIWQPFPISSSVSAEEISFRGFSFPPLFPLVPFCPVTPPPVFWSFSPFS